VKAVCQNEEEEGDEAEEEDEEPFGEDEVLRNAEFIQEQVSILPFNPPASYTATLSLLSYPLTHSFNSLR